MRSLNLIYFIYWQFSILEATIIVDTHPDTYLSITQLANKYGYPMESHELVTEDGYMLKMFRIPHGKKGYGINRTPILIMHGLFGQAENFIVNGMNNGSLAYLMADNGYDVWLGNSRGNTHSRKHIKLDPSSPKFWNFSWHEIGFFDLASKIDYILLETNQKKVLYVGHSQGGTALFVLCSERPDYEEKIVAVSLLAPGAYMLHTSSPIFSFFKSQNRQDLLMKSAERFKQYEFPDQKNSLKNLANSLCINSTTFANVCTIFLEEFFGGISDEFDLQMMPLIFQMIPTVSIKQLVHYCQEAGSGHFRKWDYGTRDKNIEAYGVPEPPDYSFQNISIPIEMYSSLGDTLISHKDVKATCKELANCRRNVLMPNPKWAHIDFLFSIHAAKMINENILRFMDKYKKILN